MFSFGIKKDKAKYFLPPYEWYNDSIALWTKQLNLQLVNYTPGTISHADYTFPFPGSAYYTSDDIYNSVLSYEKSAPAGLNGFILLVHIGTDSRRKDKFYYRLPQMLAYLRSQGYKFLKIDKLLD
jgi:peptidoglycan/xylan/chitin deacetylase (PgdA/CDA1 family)